MVVLLLFYKYGKDGDFTGLSANCDSLGHDCCFEQFKEELKHRVIIKKTCRVQQVISAVLCHTVHCHKWKQCNTENLSMWY